MNSFAYLALHLYETHGLTARKAFTEASNTSKPDTVHASPNAGADRCPRCAAWLRRQLEGLREGGALPVKFQHDHAKSVKEIAAMIEDLRASRIVQHWTRPDRQGLNDWLARALRSETRRLLAEMKKAVA